MRRGTAFCTGYRAWNGVPAGARRHHLRLFPAERGIPYLPSRLRTTPETEPFQSFVLTGRELGEIAEQRLRREVCGKPGVVRIFRKSFDTKELFGTLQKVCGFANNRVDG